MSSATEPGGIRVILADPAVRTVVLIAFVVMLGFGIVAPILPLYARSFGVGYDAAGLLISAFALMRLVADPFSGAIVNRLGERRTAALGVAVVGVSSLLTGLAPTFVLAVVFRAVGGFGSAVLFTSLTSYLLKIVPKHRMGRTLSIFYGSLNLGVIAGSPIGGLVAHRFGLASPLFFYAGLLFAGGLLYLRFVHDPPRRPEAEGAVRLRLGDLLRTRAFVTTIVSNLVYALIVAGVYDTLVPLFAQDGLGMSTVEIGGVFALALATELVVLYPAGAASDRLGRRAVLIPSMAGLAVLVALVGLATSPLPLFLLMGVLGVAAGYAGVPPGAMLSDLTPDEGSGTAVAVFRFAGDLGLVVGPLAGGFVAGSLGFAPAFLVMGLPLLFAVGLAVATPETLHRGSAPAAEPGVPREIEPG